LKVCGTTGGETRRVVFSW